MGVTSRKDDQNLNYNGTYQPSAQVQAAQQKAQEYQNNQPAAYKAGQNVIAAQQALAEHQNNKPQGYNSKYGTQIDAIMEQIQNPKDFKYSFNGDELFKTYADRYAEDARQASMNAMGQAAALTGGYGSSYAEQVGNQAYNEKMRGLYDIGLDLRDRAYQAHQDQIANQYKQLGALNEQDTIGYNRHRDDVTDWTNQ